MISGLQREPIYGEVVLDATVDSTGADLPGGGKTNLPCLPEESLYSFAAACGAVLPLRRDASIQNLVKSGYLNEAEGGGAFSSPSATTSTTFSGEHSDIVAFTVWTAGIADQAPEILESRTNPAIP
ncbi:MAG: hypothetical protein H7A53_07765 [Akkermansiaceae bacterium]|nr:hypothetical protein [Akkermansiaceae bacterium]